MDLRLRPRLALTLTTFHCRVRLEKKKTKFKPLENIPIYPLLKLIEPFFNVGETTVGRKKDLIWPIWGGLTKIEKADAFRYLVLWDQGGT